MILLSEVVVANYPDLSILAFLALSKRIPPLTVGPIPNLKYSIKKTFLCTINPLWVDTLNIVHNGVSYTLFSIPP